VTLEISGIEIAVQKKDIKNMHLYVKPPNGKVTVSAPHSMSDLAIERFVRTRFSWIRRQVETFENQPRQSEREHVSGETLYVWGKQYYVQTHFGSRNSLELSGDRAVLTVREGSTQDQRDSFIREWYRSLLKEAVLKRLPIWEAKTGLKAKNWRTKYMTTRWGTCNATTGTIWLNLQLAKKTPECLDYVILHELIHFIEKNHNDNFIALMDMHLPMWREIKASLNNQTLDYMEEHCQ